MKGNREKLLILGSAMLFGYELRSISRKIWVHSWNCVKLKTRLLVSDILPGDEEDIRTTWAYEGKGPERWFKEYMEVSFEYTDRCSIPLKLSLKSKSKPQYILHTWQNNHYQKDQRKMLDPWWERGTHVLCVGVQVWYLSLDPAIWNPRKVLRQWN